jgi:CRP/FNR family cyclic AMP-dependent transcriptional regulator
MRIRHTFLQNNVPFITTEKGLVPLKSVTGNNGIQSPRQMIDFDSNPDALRKLPLFSALTASQLTWVAAAIKHRTYPAGACIVPAGETPDGLYVILSGRVRVVHEDDEGHALIAACLEPHEFFGEMGLIDSSSCPASIRAVDRCETIWIPRKIFIECIEDNAAAALCMLRCSLERLCAAHYKMANLALMNVFGRVARVLLENGHQANGEWLVDIGSEQIAAMVGASREMVSRVVKSMIVKGAVRRHKRKLIVLDRGALAEASASHRPRQAEAATATATAME